MGNTNNVQSQPVRRRRESSSEDEQCQREEQPKHASLSEPESEDVQQIKEDSEVEENIESLTKTSLNTHTDQEGKALISEQGPSTEKDVNDLNTIPLAKALISGGPSTEDDLDDLNNMPRAKMLISEQDSSSEQDDKDDFNKVPLTKVPISEQGLSLEQEDLDDVNNMPRAKVPISEESSKDDVDDLDNIPPCSSGGAAETSLDTVVSPLDTTVARSLIPSESDEGNCPETTTDNTGFSEKEKPVLASSSCSSSCENLYEQAVGGTPLVRKGSSRKSEKYKCPLCPLDFKVKIGLKSHLRVVHTSPEEVSNDMAAARGLSVFKMVRICENCGRKSFLEETFKLPVGNEAHRCQFCSLSYRSKQLRELHEGRAHSV